MTAVKTQISTEGCNVITVKNSLYIASASLLALSLTSCSSSSTVQGEVLVQWMDGQLGQEVSSGHGGKDCFSSGGFSDVREGAQVLILNDEGNPVAKGTLGRGSTSDDDMKVCSFPFEVTDANLDGSLFTVKVADRDGPAFDREELAEPVTLSLL